MLLLKETENLSYLNKFLQNYWIIDNEDKCVDELYSLLIFILARNQITPFEYPILFIKNESPDFRALNKNEEVIFGIEHTFATVQDYKMANAEFLKYPIGSKLEVSAYSPFTHLPKDEVFNGIRGPNERYLEEPYYGERDSIEWAECILKAINDKTYLLNKNHFRRYKINELLIQDDSPGATFIENIDTAIFEFNKRKSEINTNYQFLFDKINVVTKEFFINDLLNECSVLDIKKDALSKVYD